MKHTLRYYTHVINNDGHGHGYKQVWGSSGMFFCPHHLWVQKVQTNDITVGRIWVSPPPHGITTTQAALTIFVLVFKPHLNTKMWAGHKMGRNRMPWLAPTWIMPTHAHLSPAHLCPFGSCLLTPIWLTATHTHKIQMIRFWYETSIYTLRCEWAGVGVSQMGNCDCKKFNFFITADRIWVSPPSQRITTTQPAFLWE